MRIIGIDPALRITGFGIIDDCEGRLSLVKSGVIKTSSSKPLPECLNQIFLVLEEILNEFKPQVMVLEKIYVHYQHPATSFLLGEARGIICLVAERAKIELVEYSATHVKKSIVGRGQASKEQVQKMVASVLAMRTMPKYKDVTDALALAITYSNFSRAHKFNAFIK
jgi:crossover junction endodeoxyribonuclease RuvC